MNWLKIKCYLGYIRNLTVAFLQVLFKGILEPGVISELSFHFYDALNNVHRKYYNRLHDFKGTAAYKTLTEGLVISEGAFFHLDPKVIRPLEAQILSALVKSRGPGTIFEFGTYSGYTTLHFALNAPDDSVIYTLDLPKDFELRASDDRMNHYTYDDMLVAELSKANVDRRLYSQTPYKRKITELFGDSMDFDFSAYGGKIDLIFIDGNHSLAYVKKDTENAFRMIRENGVIVWHDFDYICHRDIFKYLNELGLKHKLYFIEQTRFVLYGENL